MKSHLECEVRVRQSRIPAPLLPLLACGPGQVTYPPGTSVSTFSNENNCRTVGVRTAEAHGMEVGQHNSDYYQFLPVWHRSGWPDQYVNFINIFLKEPGIYFYNILNWKN